MWSVLSVGWKGKTFGGSPKFPSPSSASCCCAQVLEGTHTPAPSTVCKNAFFICSHSSDALFVVLCFIKCFMWRFLLSRQTVQWKRKSRPKSWSLLLLPQPHTHSSPGLPVLERTPPQPRGLWHLPLFHSLCNYSPTLSPVLSLHCHHSRPNCHLQLKVMSQVTGFWN